MEEFGSIEDDFVDSSQNSGIAFDDLHTQQKSYEAFLCESLWFLNECDTLSTSNEFIRVKYKADYFYMNGDFKDAINWYYFYVNNCSNISLIVKRECLEGISRSYLSMHCYCYAYDYAMELEKISTTFDSNTACFSLMLDCCFMSGRIKDAIIFGQKLVSLHSSNSDTWLRLARAYALLHKIPLLFVAKERTSKIEKTNCLSAKYSLNCHCINSADCKPLYESRNIENKEKVVICLLYVEYHLKSIEHSASGFALQQNIELQKRIKKEIESHNFGEVFLETVRQCTKEKFARLKNDEGNLKEFVDRASSKFDDRGFDSCGFEELKENEFEERWLKFDVKT